MVTVAAAAALIIQEIQKIKMWGKKKNKPHKQLAHILIRWLKTQKCIERASMFDFKIATLTNPWLRLPSFTVLNNIILFFFILFMQHSQIQRPFQT